MKRVGFMVRQYYDMRRPPIFPIVLAGFTAFLDLYATQPLLPLLTRVFGATHVAVSLTVTASTVAVALGAPVIGRLADLIGRKRVIVGSAFALAVATALAATSRSLGELIAWRFAQGLFTPGVFAIAIAYIHEEWPAEYASRATSAYVSGTVIGGFCGRATAGLVAAAAGWPAAFLALAGLNLVAAAAVAIWLPSESHAHTRPSGGSHARSLVALLRNRQLMATDAIGFCVLFTQVAVFTYVTFHLGSPPYMLSTAALGWLFVVYLIGAAVTPLAGRWIDRNGHRAGLRAGMSIGVAGAAVTLIPWIPAVVIGLSLIATGVFVSQATASSYIGAVTVRDRGLAVGLYSLCYYTGGSLGAFLPGLFWESGGWPAAVALVVVVQLMTMAIAWRFWTVSVREGESLPELASP
jgi:MFS transporter, YNFM family, putative membrane transport protein